MQIVSRGKRQGSENEGNKELNKGASSSEDEMIGESNLDREDDSYNGSNDDVLELDETIDGIGVDDDYESSGESECENDLEADIEIYDLCVKSLNERAQKEVSSQFKALDEKWAMSYLKKNE